MQTKIYKSYLTDILSNNGAVTSYSAYLVDSSMSIISASIDFTVTSATKDSSGVKLAISENIWTWNDVGGIVHGVLIKKLDTTNAIFVDLEQDMAVDGDFVINWTYSEFLRFSISNIM